MPASLPFAAHPSEMTQQAHHSQADLLRLVESHDAIVMMSSASRSEVHLPEPAARDDLVLKKENVKRNLGISHARRSDPPVVNNLARKR
jgi:hypothetical protein